MADEISLTVTMTLKNGASKETFDPPTKKITQAAIGAHAPIVIVGTTEEVMPEGDVVTEGVLCMLNLDSANFVEFGPESAGAMVKIGRLKPGEPNVIRMAPSTVMRWKADTAAVKVKMVLLEN